MSVRELPVFTKINHLAIISENYTTSAKFYE